MELTQAMTMPGAENKTATAPAPGNSRSSRRPASCPTAFHRCLQGLVFPEGEGGVRAAIPFLARGVEAIRDCEEGKGLPLAAVHAASAAHCGGATGGAMGVNAQGPTGLLAGAAALTHTSMQTEISVELGKPETPGLQAAWLHGAARTDDISFHALDVADAGATLEGADGVEGKGANCFLAAGGAEREPSFTAHARPRLLAAQVEGGKPSSAPDGSFTGKMADKPHDGAASPADLRMHRREEGGMRTLGTGRGGLRTAPAGSGFGAERLNHVAVKGSHGGAAGEADTSDDQGTRAELMRQGAPRGGGVSGVREKGAGIRKVGAGAGAVAATRSNADAASEAKEAGSVDASRPAPRTVSFGGRGVEGGMPEVLDRIVVSARTVNRGEMVKAQIKLVPESLGKLELEVECNGGVTVRLTVHNNAALEAMQRELPNLRAALTAVGLELDGLHLGMESDGSARRENTAPRVMPSSRQEDTGSRATIAAYRPAHEGILDIEA